MKIEARIVATKRDFNFDYLEVEYQYDVGGAYVKALLHMAPTPEHFERFRIGRTFTITID